MFLHRDPDIQEILVDPGFLLQLKYRLGVLALLWGPGNPDLPCNPDRLRLLQTPRDPGLQGVRPYPAVRESLRVLVILGNPGDPVDLGIPGFLDVQADPVDPADPDNL